MEKRVKAVVQVVLDVESDSVWGTDTTWEQIAKQAEDSVRGLFTSGNKLILEQIPRKIKSLQIVEVKIRAEGK